MTDQNEKERYSEETLSLLREEISHRLSMPRYTHTLGVEKMAQRLGYLYCPEKVPMLRAAAILHDLTKEKSTEEQLRLCVEEGIRLSQAEKAAPKVLHAITAATLIEREFPAVASPELVGCVRWHTTGHAGMTLPEKLLYLADYIDETRTFPDCIRLREAYFGASPERMTDEERLNLLDSVLVTSYDMTVRSLLAERIPVSPDTIAARNELLCKEPSERAEKAGENR